MIMNGKGLGRLPNGQPGVLHNYGKPGFWGRLARKLTGFALDNLEHAGGFIGMAAHALNALTQSWQDEANKPVLTTTDSGSTYQPTRAEEAILETWFTNKFNPFYNDLLKGIDAAITLPDLAAQIAGINLAIAKMCVVQEYFMTHETQGLSMNAVQYRSDFMEMFFSTANSEIAKILDDDPTTFEVRNAQIRTSPADFLPFEIPVGTYSCQSYVIKDGNATVPVNTTTGNGTVVQTATGSTSGTNSGGTSKNNIGSKLVFAGLATWLLIESLKPKKKKKPATQTSN